ncbi:MAG: hypothetical protein ACI4J7_04700 [Ruminiclostridium sp.]
MTYAEYKAMKEKNAEMCSKITVNQMLGIEEMPAEFKAELKFMEKEIHEFESEYRFQVMVDDGWGNTVTIGMYKRLDDAKKHCPEYDSYIYNVVETKYEFYGKKDD